MARRPEVTGTLSFLCLIMPLCSYLYGGLYGGLYERAHIIRYFPPLGARPGDSHTIALGVAPADGLLAAGTDLGRARLGRPHARALSCGPRSSLRWGQTSGGAILGAHMICFAML
jgi:hypothetical protein